MSGLLLTGLRYKCSGPAKDYSDKPPLNRTSYSRSIRLDREMTSGKDKFPALSLSSQLKFTGRHPLLVGVRERAKLESAHEAIQQLR